MSDKLRNILTLALRPETGDGEATAAFTAARRLAAKSGLDGVLGTHSETQTKTVYKDRVVYMDRIIYRSIGFLNQKTLAFKLTVPATYHHTMVVRIFSMAYQLGVHVDVRSCITKNGKISDATVFELTLQGREYDVDALDREVDRCIDEIKSKVRTSPDTCSYIVSEEKPRGFIVRMIKKMAEAL